MNKIKHYARKKNHINYVRDYVCDLHNTIFHNAVNGILSPVKVELFKKYSKYLKLLEFQNMSKKLRNKIKSSHIIYDTLGTVTTASK